MGTENGVLAVRGQEQQEKRDLGRGKIGAHRILRLSKPRQSASSIRCPTIPVGTCAPEVQGAISGPQVISQVRVTPPPGVIPVLIKQGY